MAYYKLKLGNSEFEHGTATHDKKGIVKGAFSNHGIAAVNGEYKEFISAQTVNERTSVEGKFYGVEVDAEGKMYVNVPWENTVGEDVDLSEYPKTSEVISLIGSSNAASATYATHLGDSTNSYTYASLTSILEENERTTAAAYSDLDNRLNSLVIPDIASIPTKLSQLENDKNFISYRNDDFGHATETLNFITLGDGGNNIYAPGGNKVLYLNYGNTGNLSTQVVGNLKTSGSLEIGRDLYFGNNNPAIFTSTKRISIPNKSGTFALTSDIPDPVSVSNKGATLTPGGTTTIATINGTDITVGMPNVSSGDGEMSADGVLSNIIADEGGNGEVIFDRTILGPISADLSHNHDTLEVGSDGFYITDSYDNVVAKIDNAGIDSIDLKVNGQSVNNLINVTYSELKSLRNNGQLYPGRQYRITDYITSTSQTDTISANHAFDIIVTADDEYTLNEKARAIQHEGDTYFANQKLNAWEIWYCLDNDTNRFAWADESNGKGVIYRMIDEKHNDCPYDFKNIMFKHPNNTTAYPNMYYTFTLLGSGIVSDYSFSSYCNNNVIKKYTFLILTAAGKYEYGNLLNNNVFINTSPISHCSSNSFGNGCNSNSFGDNCSDNSFGNGCFSNSFGNDCYYNSFGNSCYYNSFGNGCKSNSFGNSCYYNSFGDNCERNSFGNGCKSNSFGNSCYYNSFGDNCERNSFGNGCKSNSFGNSCYYNSFGDNCERNSFGNGCYNKSFGNGISNIACFSGKVYASDGFYEE